MIFGGIIITLGCYYKSDNHKDVLNQIAHPIISKLIDLTLIVSGFLIGFVMIAGAGANAHQQFGIPAWLGTLICALLIVGVSFLDFNKITGVLGIFTPIIIFMLLVITGYTFIGKSYDFNMLSQVAKTIEPAVPYPVMSAINYYSICAVSGVSMAFVLGGSMLKIGNARKGGLIGGTIIGLIIFCASITLFANIDTVKDAEIPMLAVVNEISPVFAFVYAIVIFALIFNTAFSLFYATAKRFAGDNNKKLKIILIIMVGIGYIFSFSGFKQLVSILYPILGYVGTLLLVVLLGAWVRERENIITEMFRRRKMIHIFSKKYEEDEEFTKHDVKALQSLGEESIADSELLKQDVIAFVEEKYDVGSETD
ncbi:hypothetical protein P261_02542 [Lachnospiraceae bacterium TWA4]|nr:hypothetical protein P261_02542 [Lachnospiraceae bacterium TWA4]